MKIVVLHDKYSNSPVVVRPDAIDMIQSFKGEEGEYSSIGISGCVIDLKESIGDVLMAIKKVESENK